MRIIVCGGGPVGSGIAKQLSQEDHDVTIIDTPNPNINKLVDSSDVTVRFGFPSHPTVLQEAGAGDVEMVVAVTASDEVNMMVCQIAHSLFNVPIKIARIREQNYLLPGFQDLYRHDHMPIDYIISPEREVAQTIIDRLHLPGAMDSFPLVDDSMLVTEVRCNENCPLLNYSVKDFYENFGELNVVFLAINRQQSAIIVDEHERLQVGDELFFLAPREQVAHMISLLGHDEQEARRIVIIGGGHIGLAVAQGLEEEESGIAVKLIELNHARAETAVSMLKRTNVIQGSALEKEILQECNIGSADAVICVTNDDEVNILSSLLSKRYGAKSSVVLVNKGKSYRPLIGTLGIDVIVNPREVTVSSILQYTRRGKVRAANSICNGELEILESEAVEQAVIVGQSIHDLDLPKDFNIAMVVRKGVPMVPKPSTIIQEGDRVVIICRTEQAAKVDTLFSPAADYF